ncbi:helix-turn-helix domain-containing protein [Limibacter armeniacum]|uniref:helix-turn-helix domain-containing protein n=1 Tax=Limibacter armeniacum TaxID=466084 RepID=UPI002FE654CB
MKNLDLQKRITIERLLGQADSFAAIAKAVGVHRATIIRELHRNSEDGIYCALKAQEKAHLRKAIASIRSIIRRKNHSIPLGGRRGKAKKERDPLYLSVYRIAKHRYYLYHKRKDFRSRLQQGSRFTGEAQRTLKAYLDARRKRDWWKAYRHRKQNKSIRRQWQEKAAYTYNFFRSDYWQPDNRVYHYRRRFNRIFWEPRFHRWYWRQEVKRHTKRYRYFWTPTTVGFANAIKQKPFSQQVLQLLIHPIQKTTFLPTPLAGKAFMCLIFLTWGSLPVSNTFFKMPFPIRVA